MKSYWSLGHRLPQFLSKYLFGDRRQFGHEINVEDSDWVAWQSFYMNFYQNTQKQGVGKTINNAGYRILSKVDFTGKKVMELGPGILPHMSFWKGSPLHYSLVDNLQMLLDQSARILESEEVEFSCNLTDSHQLPFEDGEFDIIVTFYALEHLYPLDLYLQEFKRVLKPGGIFVGAIPTEGGIAWGLGRFFTSRRFIKKNTSINPDKIICWEHQNFAEEVLSKLDQYFNSVREKYYPLSVPLIDINLIVSFIYQRGNN